MIEVTKKTIDIDRLLRSKLGDKARYVPRFLVNWLKKLIWEDRINEFLWESRDEVGVPWLKHGLRFLGNEIVVDGWENCLMPQTACASPSYLTIRWVESTV